MSDAEPDAERLARIEKDFRKYHTIFDGDAEWIFALARRGAEAPRMTEEDVERTARTTLGIRRIGVAWSTLSEIEQADLLQEARAVLRALEAAGWRKVEEGFVVVPKDATEEMVNAGFDNKSVGSPTIVYKGIWRDMLAAATSIPSPS